MLYHWCSLNNISLNELLLNFYRWSKLCFSCWSYRRSHMYYCWSLSFKVWPKLSSFCGIDTAMFLIITWIWYVVTWVYYLHTQCLVGFVLCSVYLWCVLYTVVCIFDCLELFFSVLFLFFLFLCLLGEGCCDIVSLFSNLNVFWNFWVSFASRPDIILSSWIDL